MIGNVVGGYKILEKLGEGGMGAVYRGMDVMLEREVAIKSLRPELTHDPKLIERFRIEAVALARLNHPNIVTLYNFFRESDQYYMVLELVHGETLDKLIQRCGALPWQTATPLICQALAGLEHAHILKVIHRDIKPANLILTNTGLLKLMDFGIARIMETTRLTRTGRLFGTLEYMSPEQIQGRTIDARSDIYSVGVVLYEALTGHIPFERQSDFELIKSHLEEYPTPPHIFMPQLPAALETAVMRALAKNPDDRFPNAVAFRNALVGITRLASGGWESQQTLPPPPETRVYHETPLPPRTERPSAAAASAETIGRSQQSSARKHYLSYIKTYPGIIALLVLLVLAAVLVNMSHRPLASSSRQSNTASASSSPPETANSTSAEQPVANNPAFGVTAETPGSVDAAGQAAKPPEQPASGEGPGFTTTATTGQSASSGPKAPATTGEEEEDEAQSPIIMTPSSSATSSATAPQATSDEAEKDEQAEKTAKPRSKKKAAPAKSTTKAKTTPVKAKVASTGKPSQPNVKRSARRQNSSAWRILD